MDDESFISQSRIVERLPNLLRIYIGCACCLVSDVYSFDLVKIHLFTGKLTLMKFDDFYGKGLPRLLERIKINFHNQKIDVFDYSDPYIPPYLFIKSRFLNEEDDSFQEQIDFDESLKKLQLFDFTGYGPDTNYFNEKLDLLRLKVEGMQLVRSTHIPNIDQACGQNFIFRDFIQCGTTQKETGIPNIPKEADTYNALYDLAINLLDPIIDYYGDIILTYGFCSPQLSRKIKKRIAPKLDQHACHEKNRNGKYICERLGAAVDFIIEDENMREVVEWISHELNFDRLYFYGESQPIHISYSPRNEKKYI